MISRCRKARAELQLRLTVAGEMPITSAVSSTDSPAKKRSSTNWACRASSAASFPRATSSSDHVDGALLADDHGVFEQDFLTVAAAARGTMLARIIEQDAAHLGGGHGHEMTAAFERCALVHHADVGFVDERRGLHGVLAALAAEVGAGQAMQLVVDQGQKIVDGFFVPRPSSPNRRVISPWSPVCPAI